jgi:hypothetical protein
MENRRDKTACESATFASFDEMVQIAFHGFKNEIEFFGIWKKKEVV